MIRVVSVAGRVDPKPFERGRERLAAAGWRTEVDRALLDTGHPYLAAPAAQRAEDLTRAFFDERVDVVMAARGGYGAMHLLERVDFAALARSRKPFVGYSDLTALHLALNRAGLVTVHAPVVTALGKAESAGSSALIERLTEILSGGWGIERVLRGEARVGGRASGRLFGGNLSLLAACLPSASPSLPAGSLLLIEEVNEPLYRLDRLVTGLRLSGILGAFAGFALGSFEGCARDQGGPSRAASVVAEILSELGQPIVVCLPVGHGPRDEPIWLGGRATLDGDAGTLTLEAIDAG